MGDRGWNGTPSPRARAIVPSLPGQQNVYSSRIVCFPCDSYSSAVKRMTGETSTRICGASASVAAVECFRSCSMAIFGLIQTDDAATFSIYVLDLEADVLCENGLHWQELCGMVAPSHVLMLSSTQLSSHQLVAVPPDAPTRWTLPHRVGCQQASSSPLSP
jgi:hypothetical protein